MRFADLLKAVAEIHPEVRIRFTSPHPKDFPEEVLRVMADKANVCNNIHLPAQSGSSKVLADMRRGHTREAYLDLVERVRDKLPGVTLSSDFIVGFCGETEEDFLETLSLVEEVGYHKMFYFPYSLRQKTHAHRKLLDDVPHQVKLDRMERLGKAFRAEAAELNAEFEDTEQIALIAGDSKRSDEAFQGLTDGNVKVIFPKRDGFKPGDYCRVKIVSSNSQTLQGEIVNRTNLSGHRI